MVDEIVDYVGEQNRGVVEQAILRRASVVSYGHNYENDEADNGQIRKTRHEQEESRKGTVPWDILNNILLPVITSIFILCCCNFLSGFNFSRRKYLLSYWSQLNSEQNDTVEPVFS